MNIHILLSLCWIIPCQGFSIQKISSPRATQTKRVYPSSYSSSISTVGSKITLFESESSNKDETNIKDIASTVEKGPTTEKDNITIGGQEISLEETITKVVENTKSGEVGQRGEYFFVIQAVLVLWIIYGQFPFFSNVIFLGLGELMTFIGVGTIAAGIKDLGTNLSPWPGVPETSTKLVKEGIYSRIRHPIYAGLLWTCFGVSIWTANATRFFLTIILWFVLDKKATYEESSLRDKFEDYEEYEKNVNRMFVYEEVYQFFVTAFEAISIGV